MDGSVSPASIAISISIGTALLGGFISIWAATRSSIGGGDTTVSVLSGIALLLTMLNAIAAAFFFIGGTAYLGLLKATLLLTASFAVTGMGFGLLRGLRSAKATGG